MVHTYQDFTTRFNQTNYLKKVILATINDIVDEINNSMISLIPSTERESGVQKLCPNVQMNAAVQYLNTMNANDFPTHQLIFKVGILIILKNINKSLGLCGTKLIITNLDEQ